MSADMRPFKPSSTSSGTDGDMSSSNSPPSTIDGDMSADSPTSFTSDQFNMSGDEVKTSTPVEKEGKNVCFTVSSTLRAGASVFEPARDRKNGVAGGDGDRSGSGSGGSGSGGSDWFGLAVPKFGTPIPNRIFVGGISCSTTENDLVRVFQAFGAVRGAKIIFDRGGVSKGYGFVTFETEAEATALCDKILKKELQPIMLRERRLNIAPAIKKQPGVCSDSGFPTEGSAAYAQGNANAGPAFYYYQNRFQAGQAAPTPLNTNYYDYVQHEPAHGAAGYALDERQYTREPYGTGFVPPSPTQTYAANQYYVSADQVSQQMCYYGLPQQPFHQPSAHYQQVPMSPMQVIPVGQPFGGQQQWYGAFPVTSDQAYQYY